MSGDALTSTGLARNPDLPVAAAPAAVDWPFTEVLGVVFSGLGVVLSVLVMLALATALVGRFFVYQENNRQAAKKGAAKAPAEAPASDQIDGSLIAVLSAAAFEVLERPVRVVKIRKIEPGIADWSLQGRTEIHSSHKLR